MLWHMLHTRKSLTVESEETSDAGVVLARKPVESAHNFFFRGYIHDLAVCRIGARLFVRSKSYASQRKNTGYEQKIILDEDDSVQAPGVQCSSSVSFAPCKGCVAGADGGLVRTSLHF